MRGEKNILTYLSMEKTILSERQKKILKAIGAHTKIASSFYLSGGTALAAYYLFHRYSEDLDFFSEIEFDIQGITVFLSQLKNVLECISIDFQQSLNRNLFFLRFPDEVLKIEFTYYPFPRIERGLMQNGLTIDSLRDIAVNKLFTIYQRSAARDYIDLYCICKKENWQIADLLAQAKIKFDWHIDPLQLGTQFLKSESAEDVPRMLDTITPDVWKRFFKDEAKRFKPEIIA